MDIPASKLRNCWNEAGFPGRLEALPDWILLVRLCEYDGEDISIAEVCRRLGVQPRRMQRAAERRLEVAAGAVDGEGLIEGLRSWLNGG